MRRRVRWAPEQPLFPYRAFHLRHTVCVCVIAHANGGSRGPRMCVFLKLRGPEAPVPFALVSPRGSRYIGARIHLEGRDSSA